MRFLPLNQLKIVIVVSAGALSPAFAANVPGYSFTVGSAVTSTTITPTVDTPGSIVTVNGVTVASGAASGQIALNTGGNTITTVVTAPDGTTTKTYTVTVTRAAAASSNANLSAMSLSSGTLSPAFAPSTTSYTASVANATTSLTATPTVADANASVTVNGVAVTMVTTRDGRYSSIADAPATDCNQHGSSGSGGAVAAVAVGALIGAALLAHRSGHHDDQQHYADSAREADYERGYRDGLHNQRFNDRGASDTYGEGYRQGEQQRGHETNYGGNGSYGGGYDQSASFNDLVGSRVPGAESQLNARGFSNVDSFRSGSGSGTIWWNPRTRQCLQMIVVEGRADSVVDIQSHARCR